MIEMASFITIFVVVVFCILFFPEIRMWYAVKFGKVKVWFEIEELLLKETRNIEGKILERKVGYVIVKCSYINKRSYLSFSSIEFRPCLVVENVFRYRTTVFRNKEEAERIIAEIHSNPDNFIIA